VLEGRFGFLQAFCGDRAHPDAVVRGLGTDWELPRVVFKPYPCNNFTHAGVDAALRLRAQGLAPADVTAIELGVPKPVLRTIAEPPEAKARPASGCHAAFSGPYTVAAPPPVTPAASPWPPWCAASRTSAAARRSRTPSPPSCA
jgi:2-methylcitrate dehydratase PrpD